ncbi:MAG: DUF4260 family protein [Bacteroidetes bacterium]|nr:MAG: DUF4260 family protein [Bacteroidota bacterium]
MKNILKLEEAAMFALSIYGLYSLQAEWWWFALLVLGPDISMLGYLAGNNVGAACYNLFHHKAVAVVIFMAGLLMPNLLLQLVGIVLFGHSSMDRMMGYGLKTSEGFKYTHLGIIGKQ